MFKLESLSCIILNTKKTHCFGLELNEDRKIPGAFFILHNIFLSHCMDIWELSKGYHRPWRVPEDGSGTGRFCHLVCVYCLYKVTGLSPTVLWSTWNINPIVARENILVGAGWMNISISSGCYSFIILWGKCDWILLFCMGIIMFWWYMFHGKHSCQLMNHLLRKWE